MALEIQPHRILSLPWLRAARLRGLLAFGCWALSTAPPAGAAVTNVFISPTTSWNGFENVYYHVGGFWTNSYFAPGTAGVIQANINNSGAVTCAPDVRMDRDFHLNTNAWADASGSSTGVCTVVSTFYGDSTTLARAGDTVVFSGFLVTNGLAAPYSNTIIAFIKDFDAGYGSYGISSVNLNALTNGAPFSIARTIAAPSPGNHVQWGFEWTGPPARSNTVAALGSAVLAPFLTTRGATVPWTTYEAENMTLNGGTVLGPQYVANVVASESSGRQCVQLNTTGQSLQFTARAAANAIVVRYSVPDTLDGAGADYTLSLYRNGSFVQKLPMTSKYSWLYGAYPFTNNPAAGSPRSFYDEVRLLGLNINAGDAISLQKDADDSAAAYVIDLVDLENVPAPLSAPPNALPVTGYGAVGDGATDCTAAVQNCINAAQAQGEIAWMPAGTYLITGNINLPSGASLQGAGMWHTKLMGSASLYNTGPARRLNLNGNGGNIHLADFAILGFLRYRNDNEGNDGLGGSYGVGSTISRIWVEHTKTAAWLVNSLGLVVDGCRFRDTVADGINLCVGMRGTTVTNCTARGTGDDCFAIWPADYITPAYAPGLNVITHCTGQLPFLANGGAIYGGESNRIEDCLFQDIPYQNGVLLSTTFPVSTNFSGATVVQRCDVNRCGGTPANPFAGLQICLQNRGLPGLNLNHLNLANSIASGLSVIYGAGTLSNAVMSEVLIPDYNLGGGGAHGLWARNDAAGSLTVSNCTVVEYRNDSSRFAFSFLPPAQNILACSIAGGTNLLLTYAATPGTAYRVEFATALWPVSWSTVPGSATNAATSSVTFTSPLAPGSGARFYRIASP